MIRSGSSSTAASCSSRSRHHDDSIDERQRRLLTMLAWDLGSGARRTHRSTTTTSLCGSRRRRAESSLSCSSCLMSDRPRRSRPSALAPEVPLALHARYTRSDVARRTRASATASSPPPSQEGLTVDIPTSGSDAFFVDLQKAERDYSPTTMYRDYAINRELFHWESQSTSDSAAAPRAALDRASSSGRQRPAVRPRARSVRAGHAAVHVPRPGDLRRSPRGTAGRVHLATAGPDAGGAVRGRPERRGGVAQAG